MKLLSIFKNFSKGKELLIRARVLGEYGHYQEAIKEAERCRDSKETTAYEKELAKGEIVYILGKVKKIEANSKDTANYDQAVQQRL